MIRSEPFTHSAGFGGLCAVIAAVVAGIGVAVTVVQRTRTDRREEWWTRFTWLIEHADTLGGPLVAEMVDQLTESATKLRDSDLVAFAERYTANTYASVGLGVTTARPPRPDAGAAEPSPEPAHQEHNESEHTNRGDPR